MFKLSLNKTVRNATLALAAVVTMTSAAMAAPLPDARIVISVPAKTLWLVSGNRPVKAYSVGVGRPDFPTPAGTYAIESKVMDPQFESPFNKPGSTPVKRGVLGTRWMGFKEDKGGTFGIHGWNDTSSLGQYSSHGCIRMAVRDAEEVFDSVDFGTPVVISYDTTLMSRNGDAISIAVFPDDFGNGIPSLDAMRDKIAKQFPDAKIDDRSLSDALRQHNATPQRVATVAPNNGDTVLNVKGKIAAPKQPQATPDQKFEQGMRRLLQTSR